MHRPNNISERAAQRLPLQVQRPCAVPGCGRPTQRSSGTGVSERLCRRHQLHAARHGSAWRGTYTAAELLPYKRAAHRWLGEHQHQTIVVSVSASLEALLSSSGAALSAYDLRGLSAVERARVALARLREAGVKGRTLLETSLAVQAAVADVGPASHEFMIVGIAKALHRKASGTHRTTSGLFIPSKYPRSSGRVLRILGQTVWDIAAVAADALAVSAVVQAAQPEAAIAREKARRRASAEESVASEILRVSSWGWGTDRLEAYRRQLRRQHGLG